MQHGLLQPGNYVCACRMKPKTCSQRRRRRQQLRQTMMSTRTSTKGNLRCASSIMRVIECWWFCTPLLPAGRAELSSPSSARWLMSMKSRCAIRHNFSEGILCHQCCSRCCSKHLVPESLTQKYESIGMPTGVKRELICKLAWLCNMLTWPYTLSVMVIHVLQVHLVEIDIEQDPKIAEAAGVQSTPTIQMFKDKERIQHLPGVKMKSDYRKFIDEALGEKAKVPA